MAEETQEATGEGEALPDDGGPSRLPQFIILIFVILLGQAAAGYVLITRIYYPGLMGEDVEEEVVENPADRPVFDIDAPLLFPMEAMILNPPDDAGIRFLSAQVTLEVDTPEALAELQVDLLSAKVSDLILTVLTRTRFSQMDEAEERVALKERLKDEINAAGLLEAGGVTKVYFERFILQ